MTLKELLELVTEIETEVCTQELTPEKEKELDDAILKKGLKVDDYVFVRKQFEIKAKFWEEEQKRCTERKQRLTNQKNRLVEYLKNLLVETNQKSLEGEKHRITLSRTKPKLLVDEETVDEMYFMRQEKLVLDKERIRKDLEENKPIKGAKLQESYALRMY
jgi:hypothetical protein